MSKIYNLILGKHHKADINRVFELPDEETMLGVGSMLLVDTAKGQDQLVYSTSDNFYVEEDCLDSYLDLQNTNRKQLKTIKGVLKASLFGEEDSSEEEEDEPEEKEIPLEEATIKDLVETLRNGAEAIQHLALELVDEDVYKLEDDELKTALIDAIKTELLASLKLFLPCIRAGELIHGDKK